LAAAEHFRDQGAQVEATNGPSKETFAPPQYRYCWFASVVFAALAMEANAYDLMTAANRNEESPARGRHFRTDDLRKPLLDRYKLLYQVAMQGQSFPIDQGIAQDARALVLLRDEIVHSKTEWRSVATVSKKMEALLRPRISLCPFKCGDVFFPDQCVSAASATWAVATSREFIVSFSTSTQYRLTV
jgi:hypothetical protein